MLDNFAVLAGQCKNVSRDAAAATLLCLCACAYRWCARAAPARALWAPPAHTFSSTTATTTTRHPPAMRATLADRFTA